MNTVLAGFLLAAMCLLVAADGGVHKEMMAKSKACLEEHGVTFADIHKVKTGDIKPEDVDKKLKCALHCIMQKAGFMDEAGKLKIDALKEKSSDDEKKQFENALEQCTSITSDDPCEATFQTFVCIMKHKN